MGSNYHLMFEQYSVLIKWMYVIINEKDTDKRSELEKEFLRKVNYFAILHFYNKYVNLVPKDVINFIRKNNIKLILINLKSEKTGVCYGFFLRLLKKYNKNIYEDNIEDDKFEKDYLEIENLFDSNYKRFVEISFQDTQVGDVVIFEDSEERTHIGYIYNENKSILSKLGDKQISIEPLEILEDSWGFPRFYKYENENFRTYFINNIIPLIERITLNIDLVEKILLEWNVDLRGEINTKNLKQLANKNKNDF